MKIIALEEHTTGFQAIYEAAHKANDRLALAYDVLKKTGKFKETKTGFPEGIYDLGDGRIAAMDAAGIDVSILSYPTPNAEGLEPSLAKELTRQANDTLAATISKYPDRLLGFATLPMLDPAAAARELERTVRDHGFLGALINSNINGRYFDDKFFWPVFECAESARRCPSHLHPQIPPQPVVDAYYSGFAPEISAFLSIAGVGWHIDVGVHCLRLILGGVFDQFPKLQISIVSHNLRNIEVGRHGASDYSFPLRQERWTKTDHQGIPSGELSPRWNPSLVSTERPTAWRDG